jgi:hypothetical protein
MQGSTPARRQGAGPTPHPPARCANHLDVSDALAIARQSRDDVSQLPQAVSF